jgi:23S rRNA (uracil1939-C5)-methyltransferase
MSKAELSVGDSIEVTIERLAYGGEAVAHHHRLAIFVQEAAPEDRLRVRIIERKKRFARAVIEEIITPSPSRRKPPCRYFGQCGGCQLQHINYETQLTAKVGFIRDALQRTGQINWSDEIKIHAAEEFQYRLRAKIKLERVFADDETSAAQRQTAKGLRIGFYQARSHTVCDVEYCEILLPELNELLQTIRNTYTTAHINEIEIASSQIFDSEPEDLNHINLKDTGSHSYATFAETIGRQIARAEYRFAPSIFFQCAVA